MVCVLLFILLSWALQMLEVSLTLEQGQSWALGGWRLKKLTIDQVLSILHLCSFQSVSLILLWFLNTGQLQRFHATDPNPWRDQFLFWLTQCSQIFVKENLTQPVSLN